MAEEVRGFPAVRWGLSFGIVLVVAIGIPWMWVWTNSVHISMATTAAQANANQLISVVTTFFCGGSIVLLLACFLAGFLTARDVGTVGSGAFAAVLAFLAFSIVFIVVFSVILRISAASVFDELSKVPSDFHAVLALMSFSTILTLLIFALISAGIGALGALLGCAIYGRASYS